MWLFTRYGFYSVTVSPQERGKVQIRARARDDLERLLDFAGKFGINLNPKTGGVIETPRSDYRYRLIVNRERWPELAHALAGEIDYSNFKDQIRDNTRHRLYEDVWATMASLQIAYTVPRRDYLDDLLDDNLPGLVDELEGDPDPEFTRDISERPDPTDPFYVSDDLDDFFVD